MDTIKNLFKIVLGIILVLIAIWFVSPGSIGQSWGQATLSLIKGGIVIMVILIGLVLLLVGFSDIKNAQ